MTPIETNDRNARRNILFNIFSELGYRSIEHFQKENGLEVDGSFGIKSYRVLYGLYLRVVDIAFEGDYYRQANYKNQIVWHHSAGWDDARGMFDWWRKDKVYHVATSVGISDDGTIYRGFDEAFWAHHIGMNHPNNVVRNMQSIAVEICNWGGLTQKNDKLYSWANVEIPKEKTIELNFKGVKFYERYTDAEIESLKRWTLLNAMRFDIPVAYREQDMWQVSQNAIKGIPGIYTHNSFIDWKTDVSPQPHLIKMAKELINYTT